MKRTADDRCRCANAQKLSIRPYRIGICTLAKRLNFDYNFGDVIRVDRAIAIAKSTSSFDIYLLNKRKRVQ